MLTKLHNPDQGALRLVGLMSGSGSNLRRILEHAENLSKLHGKSIIEVAVIFSDNANSNAIQIGRDYDIPVIVRDIRAFYKKRKTPRSDLKLREQFDLQTIQALAPYNVKFAAYAGYMSIVTKPIIENFFGINVHPADLSITLPESNERKFKGDHAVLAAIIAGESAIHSSTHLVELAVDNGSLLMISPPVKVELPEGLSLENKKDHRKIELYNQERLKTGGDWLIFPRTLENIALGKYSRDENGNLYYNENKIPKGIRL